MNKQYKIGIMGGTFNPIHFGHLILAEHAFSFLELHSILFIPTGNPPHKKDKEIIDKKHRYRMVQLAIEDNSHFDLSDIELNQEGYSYSINTINQLKEENLNTEYYFIIGADSFFQIHNWREPEALLNQCHLVVASRNEYKSDDLMARKEELETNYQANIHILPMPKIEISSSNLRDRVKNGHTIKYMIPKDIEHYIYMNGLYK
jgi:nicotinate-nucleotide adenylyltransferase